MKKTLGFVIVTSIGVSAFGAQMTANHLATCKVEYYADNKIASTVVEIPKSTFGDSDLGYITQLYTKDGKDYFFVATYSNKLNNAVISIGQPQGGGEGYLLHTAADLNVSSLTLNDMENGVFITCRK